MRGLMQERPLLTSSLIEYADIYHGDTEIVTRTIEGPIHRTTYREAHRRARKLANALTAIGVKPGERVGTLAWNTYRHFEAYYAISGIGAVCHTINPRLFESQIAYIANHAEDRVLFLDLTFVDLVERLAPTLETIGRYVVMTDAAHMPKTRLKNAVCYEEFIAGASDSFIWPTFDEMAASSLCYTSGTTGNPKGVLYAHRSTVLHSFGACMTDVLGLSARDSVLVIVPLFHANAWGLPYAAPMVGAKLVFPGSKLDGQSVFELLETEKVTFTAGVPTVWLMLLEHLSKSGKDLPFLERLVCGGSAMPRSMIEAFELKYDVRAIHAWGMTEMSPLGTLGLLKAKHAALDKAHQIDVLCKQGRGVYGVEMKIVDDKSSELPRDGKAFGNLMVRGPWICRSYFKAEGSAVDANGWFHTGDVATLDPDGYMQITDRSKDVIKSGGEWISSIDLENAAVGHPKVKEACVIGVRHPKWDERPLLLVVPCDGQSPTKDELIEFLRDKVVKWWLPDDVVVLKELPHTATGKLLKAKLREEYKDYELPTAKLQHSPASD
ncbi:MAG: long-chain-fatty-acid--CoA ligase [Alphaproteobacteria bacterium]|nr:long-chain-fatty-acid--CoA ligase [Alphaproteobacteria bacterium]